MNGDDSPGELLEMGQVGRPHGIRGELAVDWAGEYVPKRGDTVFLQRGGAARMPFHVSSSRWHKGRLLLSLPGIEDRTAAQAFTGSRIFLRRDSLPQPAEDEIFLDDLPGWQVRLADGSRLGVIDHLEFPAGQPLWAIHDANGREILFPAQEQFIKAIDPGTREVTIDPPAGLLDIYRA